MDTLLAGRWGGPRVSRAWENSPPPPPQLCAPQVLAILLIASRWGCAIILSVDCLQIEGGENVFLTLESPDARARGVGGVGEIGSSTGYREREFPEDRGSAPPGTSAPKIGKMGDF